MSDESTWGAGGLLFSAPNDLTIDFETNGDDFSAVFSDAQLQLGADDDTLCLRQVVAIRVPINVPKGQKLVGYRQEVSFGVTRTVGIHALLIAELAGTVKVVEYDFVAPGGDASDPISIPSTGFESPVHVFSAQGVEIAQGGLIGPVPDYEATITLMIRRRSARETGILGLEGLDVAPVFVPVT